MFGWAVSFFVLAIFAGLVGFGGLAGGAAATVKVLFGVFLVVSLILLVAG
jgi:uncharacterized membrane protein YtjA (UPF0391 family)